jgi:hypothetical protein
MGTPIASEDSERRILDIKATLDVLTAAMCAVIATHPNRAAFADMYAKMKSVNCHTLRISAVQDYGVYSKSALASLDRAIRGGV